MHRPTPTAALDAVWRETGSHGNSMVALRRHMSELSELVFAADQDRGSYDWFGVSQNLKVVTAIDDVITGNPPGPPSLCSGLDDSDEGFNDMTRLRVGGMVVFTLTWQAFESAVYVLSPGTKEAGAEGRDLLKRIGRFRRVPLLDQLLAEARLTFESCLPSGSGRPDKEKNKKKIDDLLQADLVPAAAAECVRQFRNGIIHGWIPYPVSGMASDDDGSIAHEPTIVVFGRMTRLAAILVQLLFSLSFEEDALIEHECEEVPAWTLLDEFHVARVRC